MKTSTRPAAPASTVLSTFDGVTRPLPLRKNFAWTLFGNVVYAGCQWGMLVVFAKLTSPEMVGRFALGLAVAAPVIMLSNLQLRGVQATDARGEFAFADYLGLRLLTSLVALLIIAALAFLGNYPCEAGLVILTIGLAKAFESVSDIFYGLMQRRERMDRMAQSMLIKGPLSLVAMGLAVYTTRDVLWGAAAMAFTWALVLAAYDMPNGAALLKNGSGTACAEGIVPWALRLRFDARMLLRLAWTALPLGVVMGLISLNTNIPRYFVQSAHGERELGIFAALAYLLVAGNTVVAALGQSAVPRLANHYALGEVALFRRLLGRMVGLGAALGFAGLLLALVAGRPLLSLIYGSEYAARMDVFLWLVLSGGMGFAASFLGYGMTAARCFRVQAPLFALVAATTALTAWLWVPEDGAVGAAQALLASSVIQAAGSAAVIASALRRMDKNRFGETC